MSVLRDIEKHNGKDIEILIEVDDSTALLPKQPAVLPPGPFSEAYEAQEQQLREAFKSARELISVCAINVSETIQKMAVKTRPSEWEVQLGIKFNAELNAVLAKAQGESQLQVTLRWQSPEIRDHDSGRRL
ncbi:CU044_2847 family protein [Ktedonospora formicarum]|uniref:Trypsin-co-occurring domain-containing protein n=1 Tax=Ktedonospora formicarum TaxID=2778364 RepID=A0A8J3IBN8_9CHLR|nr:CU044_2847 family protein [Ktedonospora formicarum]GHO48414.1 hypothetical protein KSX_65770 [Ktedonospora formicarum]